MVCWLGRGGALHSTGSHGADVSTRTLNWAFTNTWIATNRTNKPSGHKLSKNIRRKHEIFYKYPGAPHNLVHSTHDLRGVNYFPITMISELAWRRATATRWSLQIAHIKGSFNVIADQLSRDTILSTEWSFQKEDFLRILAQNRNIQVDLFATSLNNQLKTFVSP